MGANGNKEYRDSTHISSNDPIYNAVEEGTKSEEANTLAQWIREKQWGVDVRESLALFVSWLDVKVNDALSKFSTLLKRQDDVESRQSSIEGRFKDVLANATKDSEVIEARDSDRYGKFNVLGDRLENMETLLATFVPSGFVVRIKHHLNHNPSVLVEKYDWALGTETDGFGTSPDGMFGGSAVQSVPTNLIYKTEDGDNYVYVYMPTVYKQAGDFTIIDDQELLLIDGIHTLRFELEGGLINGDFGQ